MMTSPEDGFLRYAKLGMLVIVDDVIFLVPSGGDASHSQPIGSLAAFSRSYASHSQVVSHNTTLASIGLRAHGHAAKIVELRFCVEKLLPFLTFLQTDDSTDLRCPEDIRSSLDALSREAAAIPIHSAFPRFDSQVHRALTLAFPNPCAIVGDKVVPLQRLNQSTRTTETLVLNSAYYRLCHNLAKSLSVARQSILSSIESSPTNAPTSEKADSSARFFLGNVNKLLARFSPVRCGPYRVLYEDICHQLQFGDHGHIILVCGPLSRRCATGDVYCGLEIAGKSQRQMLTKRPSVNTQPGGFWTPQGLPATRGMCMGKSQQYDRLSSNLFSVEESVVQWLNAAVIIATNRPAFHRAWRARRTHKQ